MGSTRAPLDRRRAQWIAAANRGDLDGYLAVLAEDVVWLPPGLPPLTARAAIRAWMEPLFATYEYDVAFPEQRVIVAGDRAIEHGRFTSRLRPRPRGAWMEHAGTYVVWWREEQGEWSIDRYADVTAWGFDAARPRP